MYNYSVIFINYLTCMGYFLVKSHYKEKDLGGKKDIRFTYYVWLGQSNGIIPTIIGLLSLPFIIALIYNLIN